MCNCAMASVVMSQIVLSCWKGGTLCLLLSASTYPAFTRTLTSWPCVCEGRSYCVVMSVHTHIQSHCSQLCSVDYTVPVQRPVCVCPP